MTSSSTSHRTPFRELEGYDMVVSPSLSAGNGFDFQKDQQGTNSFAHYAITEQGKKVGTASLNFILGDREVDFDIAVSEKGRDIAATALRGLASSLDERGFSLVTGGIMTESRGYWEHLAQRGDVVAVDASDPKTQYRVVPAEPSLRQTQPTNPSA